MDEKEYKELIVKLAAKIEEDISKVLQKVSTSLHVSNMANGTSDANGIKFSKDEMSDFIADLLVEVHVELEKKPLR